MEKINILGKRFGKLVAISEGRTEKGLHVWLFRCDCGTERLMPGAPIRAGRNKSCGCLKFTQLKTHGDSATIFYKVWKNMKSRCLNPKNSHYHNYGGRGITICPQWLIYENFKSDMFDTYDPSLTIERKNTNGNYEPDNCCWATIIEQMRNRRTTRIIDTPLGCMSVIEASEKFKVNRRTLVGRLNRGVKGAELFSFKNFKTGGVLVQP